MHNEWGCEIDYELETTSEGGRAANSKKRKRDQVLPLKPAADGPAPLYM